MKEEKTLFQRFRLWLAGVIGGSVYTYELRSTKGANQGWQRTNDRLNGQVRRLQSALADAANEIRCSGTIAHRIRMLKKTHALEMAALKKAWVDELLDTGRAGSRKSANLHIKARVLHRMSEGEKGKKTLAELDRITSEHEKKK